MLMLSIGLLSSCSYEAAAERRGDFLCRATVVRWCGVIRTRRELFTDTISAPSLLHACCSSPYLTNMLHSVVTGVVADVRERAAPAARGDRRLHASVYVQQR